MKILVRVCDRGHTHCVYMSNSSKIPQFVTCVQAYVEYNIRVFLLPVDLIPNCLLLHLEAGRNLETFIASTCGLKPFSSTYLLLV